MPRHRTHLIPMPDGPDLTGGTAEDILMVLDSIVAEGQGLAPDEVRALRDALAEAVDATIPDEPYGDAFGEGFAEPFGEGFGGDMSSAAGMYLDVDGLAKVWNGLGHIVGVGEA